MIRTSTLAIVPRLRISGRAIVWLLLALMTAAMLALGAAVGAVVTALELAPPGVATSVRDGAVDLPLESPIRVEPQGWDTRLESVALFETRVDREGRREAERELPVRIDVVRQGWQPGETELMIRPDAGMLRPDATYRLMLRSSALEMALPWPRPAPFEREVRFSTPASPRPLAAPPTPIKWEEPLRIRWNAPIVEFSHEVSPAADSRGWVNPADPWESFVVVENPDDAATYRVVVTGARGAGGIELQWPETFTVVAPVRPRLLEDQGLPEGENPLTLEVGNPVTLRWNVPLETLHLQISPSAVVTWEPDGRDPTITRVRLNGLEQGTAYELMVAEAQSRDGAPLVESSTIALVTPPKLMVEDLDTGTDAARVSVKTQPILIFAEPIRDHRVAEAAISVEPALRGRFEWLDEQRVKFIPNQQLPYDTQITFRIRPGPDGPRSVAGGYFERPAVLSFTTEIDKIIDVDVTRQMLTLIEEGRAVRTFSVQTGVPGADTPLGEFNVQYKMPTARFRGTNVNGVSYDIPDVKWVLAFMGDYTIHGVYWRSGFGRPGSNGCVGLTDENAKAVYDWAPEGTLIRIHY